MKWCLYGDRLGLRNKERRLMNQAFNDKFKTMGLADFELKYLGMALTFHMQKIKTKISCDKITHSTES